MSLVEYIVWHATLVGIVVVNVCSLAALRVVHVVFWTIAKIITLRFSLY